MIDICQWRVSIGVWCCHQTLCSRGAVKTSTTTSKMHSLRTSAIAISLILLLALSGDIEPNPGPKTGSPSELLQTHSANLINAVTPNLHQVTAALLARQLITQETKSRMMAMGMSDYEKASKLVFVMQQSLRGSLNPEHYLVEVCQVLQSQKDNTLTEIAIQMLQELGQSTIVEDTQIRSLDPEVQKYSEILRTEYKCQSIIPADWPPRYGDDFFGRLKLLEIQDSYTKADTLSHKAWFIFRGKISEFSKSNSITPEDVLNPTKNGQSLRVVVDGPPGIGKTTLCRKLLNLWANGELTHQGYDLVLYCPLRNDRVAKASTLTDLFVVTCHKPNSIAEWACQNYGMGLLIIFDGWDELSKQQRQCSLAAKIIRREELVNCSVVVTCSYASASLLKTPTVNRHVEVVGFSESEVKEVIRGTLREEPEHAEKLIEHLEIRADALSLCYIPLVCSIVISVCRTKEQFPVTLTELYQDFILQTIRRHVEINKALDVEPIQIHSLDDLPPVVGKAMNEMCHLAYLGLKEDTPRMTFTPSQLKQELNKAVEERYLGLMTTFTVYDKESHQFLHLTIQEFLAAWWITKNNKEEEIFKSHCNDDHFRMCLRFVVGLTHLENMFGKQTTPNSHPAEKPYAEGTSLGFCSKQDSKEGKGRTDSDVPLLSSDQSDTEGPRDDTSVSYGIQRTLVPRDTESPPTSLLTHLSGDISPLSGWSNDDQKIPQQPKVESRQSPAPTPRNLHSMYSVENARYSVAEIPHPDHSNDNRHFYLCDHGNRFKAFGVFDGHDGSNASEFASSYMEKYMETRFLEVVESQVVKHTFGEKLKRVLSEMFIKTDHAFFYRIRRVLDEKKQIRKVLQGHTSYEAYMLFPNHVARLQEIELKISGGTTAVVAVLVDDWLYVANAGDSRAVLVQELDDNENQLFTTQLSTDHTVDNEDELCRLEALGLDPEELKKTGRLGSQENTRCIGDYLIKEGYTEVDTISHAIEPPGISVPNITGMKVPANSQYLLLMTDGVYKSLESMQDPSSSKTYDPMQDLVKRIQEAENKSPKIFQEISKLTLLRIEENHHKTYQEHAQSDVQSPLAVQCRKRDDMTLTVYRFRHN